MYHSTFAILSPLLILAWNYFAQSLSPSRKFSFLKKSLARIGISKESSKLHISLIQSDVDWHMHAEWDGMEHMYNGVE